MNFFDLKIGECYLFDGYTLLKANIKSIEPYYEPIEGTVIFSKYHLWTIGYSYDRWDFRDFEILPYSLFNDGLNGYLNFLDNSSYREIKMYFKLKDELLKDDFLFRYNLNKYSNLTDVVNFLTTSV